MHSKVLTILAALALSLSATAQIQPSASRGGVDIGIGGGVDYWRGDWGKVSRFGPSAWATADLWHGIGVVAEGHSMIAGGNRTAQSYKYYVGEGGAIYNYHRWHNVTPFVKAELGFASLSFPHRTGATYTHDTRNTWAVGGGFEYRLWKHVWARADYTYDSFPNFQSPVTGKHHSLDPGGFALGGTYHFR